MSIASIDLNLLFVLHTVLAERNVARAAERLHVTPSAVSNALSRLRDAVGDPLVTRKGRGIVPTPRALDLQPVIARAVEQLEEALQSGPFDPARCTRMFTLAVADAGQLTWAPAIAAAMRREMPLAHLRVVGIDALVSLGDLGSSEIDLHLGKKGRGAGLYVERLFEERSVLVARRGHPAVRRRASRASLAALRHVKVDLLPGRNLRDAVDLAYARASIPRDVAMTAPSFTAAAAIVAASDLVATLPASLHGVLRSRFALAVVPGAVPSYTIEMALSWHERTHADPAARAFRDVVRRAALGVRRSLRA